MKKNSRGPGLSPGTVFMLLLTLAVIGGCTWFMIRITGREKAYQAAEILSAFTFAQEQPGLEDEQIPAYTLAPAATATPVWQVTAAPTASPTPVPEKISITVAAAGTVYAPKAIRQTVEEKGSANFTPVFAGIADVLAPADLAIVTLETTTAGAERGYDHYNTPAQLLDALRACGVDLVSLATERALDKDYEGLAITMQEVARRGLAYAGASPEGEGGATVMRIGGVQVAVLAYSYGLSEEGEKATDGDAQGMLATIELSRVRSDIAKARHDGANVVIVLPHWGTKNKQETPEVIRRMAGELAQAGADVILGTHPNVPQGIERIKTTRADGLDYETVVCYSLGSLLTDARTRENTAGMAAEIVITYDPVTRRIALSDTRVTPLYIARTKVDDAPAYRIIPAEDEKALSQLDEAEREAARQAAQIVYQAAAEVMQR